MKAKDIEVGKVYLAKVSGSIQPVKITKDYTNESYRVKRRSWNAVNLNTGRSIWIKSAQRLRQEVTEEKSDKS